jgi:hypothetical protein
MPPIDRRALVRAAAAAAGAFALPEILQAFARAQDPQPGGTQPSGKQLSRAEQVAAAVARSKAEGKPLLVFVIPARRQDQWLRQLRLSAFLNHGGSNALLEVALCVPVCARVDELKAHLGGKEFGGKEIAGEPMMLLFDFAGVAAPVVLAIDPKVDELPQFVQTKQTYEEFLGAEKKAVEAGIESTTAELHKALHVSLHGGGDSLTRLSQRVRDRLAEQEQQKLDAWLAARPEGGAVPGDEVLVRAAAIVRVAAGKQPDAQRAATTAVLLGAIDRALVHKRVAGSRWASATGCGEVIEDPEPGEAARYAPACGMGHVPQLSERFLDFLTGS